MPKVTKKIVKKVASKFTGKTRPCKCGKSYKYAGKGRPFSRCPACRKEK